MSPSQSKKDPKAKARRFLPIIFLSIVLFYTLSWIIVPDTDTDPKKLENMSEFKDLLQKREVERVGYCYQEQSVSITIKKGARQKYDLETDDDGPHFTLNVHPGFTREYIEIRKEIQGVPHLDTDEAGIANRFWGSGLIQFLFQLMMQLLFFFLIFGRGFMRHMGLGKSDDEEEEQYDTQVTLADVKGMEEAKEQVQDIIKFLKNPGKYQAMGVTPPKGAILVGPPGNGKTFLARAIAGEASVPFFYRSGASFDEVLVGMGAQRVRSLFTKARKKAPCIIFIDEIDTLGMKRDGSYSNYNNQTLLQFLCEIDGFKHHKAPVFIIGATNRIDLIDTALLRSGRLGSLRIFTNPPVLQERKETFKGYISKLKKRGNISATQLAKRTFSFSYADISDVVNKAGVIAVRNGDPIVTQQHCDQAINEKMVGVARKSKILTKEESEVVAYHEAGHAIINYHMPTAPPVLMVTIIPRTGPALGFMQPEMPEKKIYQQEYITDQMCIMLGGRAAEQAKFKTISTGAENDLTKCTKEAYRVVGQYGMNKKVGNVSYPLDPRHGLPGWTCSEKTKEIIDEEVQALIKEQYERAQEIINNNSDQLERIAAHLLEKEVLHAEEFKALMQNRALPPKEKEKALPPPLTTKEGPEEGSTDQG